MSPDTQCVQLVVPEPTPPGWSPARVPHELRPVWTYMLGTIQPKVLCKLQTFKKYTFQGYLQDGKGGRLPLGGAPVPQAAVQRQTAVGTHMFSLM